MRLINGFFMKVLLLFDNAFLLKIFVLLGNSWISPVAWVPAGMSWNLYSKCVTRNFCKLYILLFLHISLQYVEWRRLVLLLRIQCLRIECVLYVRNSNKFICGNYSLYSWFKIEDIFLFGFIMVLIDNNRMSIEIFFNSLKILK